MSQKFSPRRMAYIAMIAALYCAVSVCLLPLSFGAVQVRIAEALTMTAIFGPVGIWGVTLGCALTNAIGIMTGANIIGVLDVLFGTAATLLAGWMSYGLRGIRFWGLPIAASLPPVLVNAVVIGGELCYVIAGGWNPAVFLFKAGEVGVGNAMYCCLVGVCVALQMETNGMAAKFAQA